MTEPAPTGPETALIVGISGPSSSGKTTLARLLQRIFNGVRLAPSSGDTTATDSSTLTTFIIHEDDFYYPDDQIPYTTTPSGKTVQDWDTAAAIDTAFLAQALSYVRAHGHLPPRLESKEDQNEAGASGVPDTVVDSLRSEVQRRLAASTGADRRTIAFMEGFLLYSAPGTSTSDSGTGTGTGSGEGSASTQSPDPHYPSSPLALRPVHAQIQLPLFLPAPYSTVKARREGRNGYVTIGPAPEPPSDVVPGTGDEGKEAREVDLEQEDDRPPQNFWTDPPGYVDDIVWPRYVRDHAWLLVGGEADGVSGDDIVARVGEGVDVRTDVGVKVAPGRGAVGMEVVLRWAVEEVLGAYLAW
ncbi:uncharacterized protein N7482_007859 [Penicillium canariense]|uniref:Phosphoribulokinase/uridine kinase domain-containing protein n=1 Tax=Penicillium canariense TaxID=189055 RepID=A0A9W9I2I5_9EURO|nr:uncharacterized protein N7482_007859 [Penicillium canariense]KAJ5160855.1 hypothetical protein N7482_007859 [Penicillium canariense]